MRRSVVGLKLAVAITAALFTFLPFQKNAHSALQGLPMQLGNIDYQDQLRLVFEDGSYPQQLTSIGDLQQPDNTAQIGYIMDGEVWIMDPGSDANTQITFGTTYVSLVWSPDGVYIAAVDEDKNLDLVDVGTGSINTIGIACISKYIPPTWSPDSQKIVYEDCAESTLSTKVMDSSGQVLVNYGGLMKFPAWNQTSDSILFFDTVGDDLGLWEFDISKNQSTLLSDFRDQLGYFAYPESVYYTSDSTKSMLWIYQSEGYGDIYFADEAWRLYGISDPTVGSGDPIGDWSPERNQYIYQTGNLFVADHQPIYIYDTEKDERKVVWDEGGLNPRWSPNGDSVAFTTWKGGLLLLDLSTGGNTYLLPDHPEIELHEYLAPFTGDSLGYYATIEFEATWSADGEQILFSDPNRFTTVDVNTGEYERIENGSNPSWRPEIAYQIAATSTVPAPTETPAITVTTNPATPTSTETTPIATNTAISTVDDSDTGDFELSAPLIIALGVVLLGLSGAGVYLRRQRRNRTTQADEGGGNHEPEPIPPIPASVAEPSARLISRKGNLRGQSMPVSDGFKIGRGSGSDIVLQTVNVSRNHALLRYALGYWYLQDQQSQGGTYVNGERIDSVRLQNGDRIRIGDEEFEFHID